MIEEKRRNPRLDFGVLVHHNYKRRMSKDISLNGTFKKRERWDKDIELAPIGSKIDFSFDFPNTKKYIDVKGVVIHHGKNEDGMEIWFKRIDDRSKEFIRVFVRDHL